MNALGYRFLLMVAVGGALVFLAFTNSASPADSILLAHVGSEITKTNWKVKENGYHHPIGSTVKKRDTGSVNLEDYRPVDPTPSSREDAKSGTIEHDTPLMPYVPHPTPPGPPKSGGSP